MQIPPWLIPAAVLPSGASIANSANTLDNLQAAFNGERICQRPLLAFAQKADEEGYGEVASTFRAAAKAAEIHANNHAAVIRQLGAEPVAHLEHALQRLALSSSL